MSGDIVIPIHRAIDSEVVKGRIQRVGVKGLDIDKAKELGLMERISTILCAMHSLTMVSHRLYGEVNALFDMAHIKKHEIKAACNDFEKAYDRWFKFWRGYQTVDGVKQMNNESADLLEQFMRWSQIPVHWELGDSQDAVSEREPMIEIDRGDRIWRVYRDVGESEIVGDVKEEWAVMRSDRPDGKSTMTCVERGLDKSSAFMCACRMSANDKDRLYTASKFESFTEKRLEVVPFKAYLNGETIGDIKSTIKQKKKEKDGKDKDKA